MVVVMEADAPAEAIEAAVAYVIAMGADVHRSSGQTRTILGVVGGVGSNDAAVVGEMEGVAKVVRVTEPFKVASRRFRERSSIVEGEWGAIGAERPWVALEAGGSKHGSEPRRRSWFGAPIKSFFLRRVVPTRTVLGLSMSPPSPSACGNAPTADRRRSHGGRPSAGLLGRGRRRRGGRR